MNRCQCVTIHGKRKQCLRDVKKGHKYCWQHLNCQKPIQKKTLQKKTTQKKTIQKKTTQKYNPQMIKQVTLNTGDSLEQVRYWGPPEENWSGPQPLTDEQLDTQIFKDKTVTLMFNDRRKPTELPLIYVQTGNTLREILTAIINWQNTMLESDPLIFGDSEYFQELQKRKDPLTGKTVYIPVYGVPEPD